MDIDLVIIGFGRMMTFQEKIAKIVSTIILALFAAPALSDNISFDCFFEDNILRDIFIERYPQLFETQSIAAQYKNSGLKVPNQSDLDELALNGFLYFANLKIRSIEIDNNFGELPWVTIDNKIIQMPGEVAEWTPKKLTHTKYFPAFSITHMIDRSDLSYSAIWSSFPPIAREMIYWSGTCKILPEPENKF